MAYRKTEGVLAHLEGTRLALIAATISIISKDGINAVDVKSVAKVARDGSIGMFYKHFKSKEEIVSAAVAHVMEAEIAVMQEAARGKTGYVALEAALNAYDARMTRPKLTSFLFSRPTYLERIRDELARLIKAATNLSRKDSGAAATAMIGVLWGFKAMDEAGPTDYALKCALPSAAQARKRTAKT